jgi:hypothetical protein
LALEEGAASSRPGAVALTARALRLDDWRLHRGPGRSLNPVADASPALALGPLLRGLLLGPPHVAAADAAAASAANAAGASAVYGLGRASAAASSAAAASGGGGGQSGNGGNGGNGGARGRAKALFHKDAAYGDVENALFHYRQANTVYSPSLSTATPHCLALYVQNAAGAARLRLLRAERVRGLLLPLDTALAEALPPGARASAGSAGARSLGALEMTTTPPPPAAAAAANEGGGGGGAVLGLPPWLLARVPAGGLPAWAWAALADAERDVEVAVAALEDALFAVAAADHPEAWASLQAELGVARRVRSVGGNPGDHVETALQVQHTETLRPCGWRAFGFWPHGFLFFFRTL